MSELKYMDLSLDEILKNLNRCKKVVVEQEESIGKFRDIILSASNRRVSNQRKTTIFLAGAGRSGFVAKAFAMRLMHLGFYVYVFNETIAPPVKEGDIIIIVSKSGKSNSITQIVEDSKIDNVKFLAVCGNTESDLALKSDARIVIDSLPQTLVNLEDSDIEKFMDTLPRSLTNFETDEQTKTKIENLPRKSSDLTNRELTKSISDLPFEIRGISNIYRPLELILMGTAFELSALVVLDALVNELMWNLNLREKDLKAYHDVLSSSI
ncbi:SIS domain-containing protein [uncultured Methanobrevibacter sp.]|uniref:SIS domain-containing protein n=1 Tax=uncultured Methanobrevibacter sp. TaxID=253161 RepID=UPI002602E573|nr:SIS domain-containing protein [uncultured Methanobrevibacter sp.]